MSDVHAYIDANLGRFRDELFEFLRIPSIRARSEHQPDMQRAAEWLAARMRDAGLEASIERTPGHPIVVGEWRGAGPDAPTVLIYGHYDVQPAEPLELWTSPPFEPEIRDGKVYARGVADDKGEFVARLAAFDAGRAAHGGALPCGVTFVVEGEEEVSSPHIAPFVLEHLDLLAADGSLWEGGGVDPDGRPGQVLGFRGIIACELFVETMTRDAHSGSAHILPSA